ncbi:hypothetical protein QW131_07020 [Roseibium salinum]|nr:hypothetical protein [Roseibium salinum]
MTRLDELIGLVAHEGRRRLDWRNDGAGFRVVTSAAMGKKTVQVEAVIVGRVRHGTSSV